MEDSQGLTYRALMRRLSKTSPHSQMDVTVGWLPNPCGLLSLHQHNYWSSCFLKTIYMVVCCGEVKLIS